MPWRFLGWLLVVYLVLQTVYGLFHHQRVFLRLATRARQSPDTGRIEKEVQDPLAERVANRYLRRVGVMFVLKLAGVLVLLALLLA